MIHRNDIHLYIYISYVYISDPNHCFKPSRSLSVWKSKTFAYTKKLHMKLKNYFEHLIGRVQPSPTSLFLHTLRTIIVDGQGEVTERKLGNHQPGTLHLGCVEKKSHLKY